MIKYLKINKLLNRDHDLNKDKFEGRRKIMNEFINKILEMCHFVAVDYETKMYIFYAFYIAS